MIIIWFFCNEVIIKMLKILKMSLNLKKNKLLAFKIKIVSKNHLIRNLNKNKQTKLNKIINFC